VELTALEVLDVDTMRVTLETLKNCIVDCLTQSEYIEIVEEYMDCLKQLCGSKVPKGVKLMIRELLVKDLASWIDMSKETFPGLSSKSRFACMDLKDLLVN
jgi:actin-like ATPase involved in cell morphogenesis